MFIVSSVLNVDGKPVLREGPPKIKGRESRSELLSLAHGPEVWHDAYNCVVGSFASDGSPESVAFYPNCFVPDCEAPAVMLNPAEMSESWIFLKEPTLTSMLSCALHSPEGSISLSEVPKALGLLSDTITKQQIETAARESQVDSEALDMTVNLLVEELPLHWFEPDWVMSVGDTVKDCPEPMAILIPLAKKIKEQDEALGDQMVKALRALKNFLTDKQLKNIASMAAVLKKPSADGKLATIDRVEQIVA